MLKTAFYIPEKIAGMPTVNGLFLLWGIGSVILLLLTLRRKDAFAEILGFAPLLALFGAVIYFILPNLMESGHGIPIRGFGVMLLLGVVCGVGLSIYRARQMGVDPDVIYSLAFWMFLGGIIGARMFYVIEYRQDFVRPTLLASLAAMVNVPEGGIVLYGAFFGGIFSAMIFFRSRHLPALALADIIAPGMVLGGSLGRIGCLLNGCCFGGLCEPPFPGVTFPSDTMPYVRQAELGNLLGLQVREEDERLIIKTVLPRSPADQAGLLAGDVISAVNSEIMPNLAALRKKFMSTANEIEIRLHDGRIKKLNFIPPTRSLPVHPAQLYDAINLGLLTLVLWFYYPLRRHDGEVLALLLTLYPISRYVMEIIRIDEPSQLGTGLSISQLISLGLLCSSVPLWMFVSSRPNPPALPMTAANLAGNATC